MQFSTLFLAIAAVMAVNVSATERYYNEQNCKLVDANSEFAETSGILNNLLAHGLLNDNSQRSSSFVVCDD
ncbi:hypothetical protein BCR43DRAFT_520572 [Syncephalastrum racemosum]|uniref:Uncharacterized protein n=1 Tax=Syncephalastrum racemosum TaxID=13706 RepID=A0A1X2HV00_SYNRA|nr:hypothetical protein BCR43DRAFT_520572 [Syncephalastrum racemosum]